jgi:hypothetical protein
MRAIDRIVHHAPNLWVNPAGGDAYTVVWASPREVVAISDNGAWLGSAAQFVQEFVECAD